MSKSKSIEDALTFTGLEILESYDWAAEAYGRAIQQAVLELEFQVRRTDGTWVSVDPGRVRVATRGRKT